MHSVQGTGMFQNVAVWLVQSALHTMPGGSGGTGSKEEGGTNVRAQERTKKKQQNTQEINR